MAVQSPPPPPPSASASASASTVMADPTTEPNTNSDPNPNPNPNPLITTNESVVTPPPPPPPQSETTNTTAAQITEPNPNPNPNPSRSPNPICYKFLPDNDELIHVLDTGCDRIEHNKIAKVDLYADHVWKVLADVCPVVYNLDEFVVEAPRCPDPRGGGRRIQRLIATKEGFWQQVGAKSCVTNLLGVCIGWEKVFKYVIGRASLEEAGAHSTCWRMTELVSVQGDGLRAICRIRNTDKSVVAAALARRRAHASFRKAQDKYATSLELLEARRLKAQEAEEKRQELQGVLQGAEDQLKAAQDEFGSALAQLATNYNQKVEVVKRDLQVAEPIVEGGDHDDVDHEEEINEPTLDLEDVDEDEEEINEPNVEQDEEEEDDDDDYRPRDQEVDALLGAISLDATRLVIRDDDDIEHAPAQPGQKLPPRRSKAAASGEASTTAPKAPQTSAAGPAPAPAPASAATQAPAGASPVLGVQDVNSRAQLPQSAQPAAVPDNLEFLCNSSQLQTLQAMVQANPQILQPVIQELKKNNSQMARVIQDHQDGFIRLLNEPVEGGNPLDLFPQGLPDVEASTPGNLFLRNSPQFQALRTMVQANPQILRPMLEEIGKQNPQSARLIQDFIQLINESVEGADSEGALGDLGAAMPQAVTVTPEEREAIERRAPVQNAVQIRFLEELDPCVKEATLCYPSKDDPYAVEIKHTDLGCLAPKQYLSDPIIDFYIRYLQESAASKSTSYFFNTFFYTKLKKFNYENDDFSKLRNWWKGGTIFENPYILLPVHEGTHWSLAIICFPTNEDPETGPTILHLDSLRGQHESKSIFKNIKRFVIEEWNFIRSSSKTPVDPPFSKEIWENLPNKVKEKVVMVPQQQNGYDCGVFVMLYIKRFREEEPKRKLAKDSMFTINWFSPQEADKLRSSICEVIVEEFRKLTVRKQ